MKHKIVFNDCYGGFDLSETAEIWLREHGWTGRIHLIPRHDPLLVECVEKFGDKASGPYSKLRIEEISGDRYRIEEYDGWEDVITPSSIAWTVIKED